MAASVPEAPFPRRRALGPVALVAGLLLAIVLVVGIAYFLRTLGDLIADTVRTAGYVGLNWPKGLAFFALGVVFLLAFPLAIVDGVSSARFRRAERELREARPADAVHPYEGPEGRGLIFDGPDGRALLLRAPGGLGAPRLLALPAAEPVAVSAEPAARG